HPVDHADMHEQRGGGQPIVAFLEAIRILMSAGQLRDEIFERLEHRAILLKPPILAQTRANSEQRMAYRDRRKANSKEMTYSRYSPIAIGYWRYFCCTPLRLRTALSSSSRLLWI